MFGILRFVFALMVVFGKFAGVEVIPGIGVWGFFILSGFLMTLVLNEKYTFGKNGLRRFFISRILRLYPCYYAVMLLTMVLYVFLLGYDWNRIGESFFGTYRDITANLLIFGNTIFGIGRADVIVPISWAVDVEMLMYIASVIFIARSPKCALYSLIATLVLFPVLWIVAKNYLASGETALGSNLIYSFLPAALLPYSLGSAIYHYRKRFFLKYSPLRAFCLLFTLVCIGLFMPKYSVTLAFLSSLPVSSMMIIMLYRAERSEFDNVIGDLTYPVYLTVGTVNTVLHKTDFFNFPNLIASTKAYTSIGLACALLILLGIAYALILCVDKPIQKYRKRFTANQGILDKAG